jgi:3-(3-hydroxy-phenyl)propionate hydroxylase
MRASDVVIVGYGPTAAILANFLGAQGWSVDIFERSTSIFNLPRAVHFDDEVMRIFQKLRLAQRIEARTQKVKGMDLVSANGDLLARYAAPKAPTSQGWYEGYMFHQPELEQILRDGVARYPNVREHLGTEVHSIDIDPHGVVVQGLGPMGPVSTTAKFLVGCCGARSITGSVIDTAAVDFGADQGWVVIDVQLLRDLVLPDVTVQYCDPARPSTYIPLPGHMRRFELMLLPGEQASEMLAPKHVSDMISRWMQPDDYVVKRAAAYTFHATLASRWRKGLIMVAGDAAHQMPPFLGQGLGAGARDAANLSWKLNLVLKGIANATLLDTYQTERSPHVRATIESDLWLSNIIQTRDIAIARQRDQQMAAATTGGVLVPPSPQLGGELCDSGELCRRPFIQPVLPTSQMHDETLGDGFALIGPITPSAWADTILQAVGVQRIPNPCPQVKEWLQSHGVTSVLVRPDRYVHALIRDAEGLDQTLKPLANHLQLIPDLQ